MVIEWGSLAKICRGGDKSAVSTKADDSRWVPWIPAGRLGPGPGSLADESTSPVVHSSKL